MVLSGSIRCGGRFSCKTTGGSQMGAKMLAGVTGLLMVAGVAQAAHAEFTFRNDTGERVVFNLQCRNAGYEALSIDANRSRTYRCPNGARDALLEVYTDG